MTTATFRAPTKAQILEYTTEILDRWTGQLVLKSIGQFYTVTELGQQYGKGPKEIRVILHHMGLLRPEGIHGSYRLAPFAAKAGYGKRLKPKKSKWPFDSISPRGQELIAAAWDHTIDDLANEQAQCPALLRAKEALQAFCAERGRELTTQEGVTWLEHFKYADTLTQRQMASMLSASEQLVGRYVKIAAEQRDFRQRASDRVLPCLNALQRLEASCSPERAERLHENGRLDWWQP